MWIRVVLVWAGSFPIFYGAAAMLSGSFLATIEQVLFRSTVAMTPELSFVVKPLGIHLVMFGLLLLYAAFEPEKNTAIISWGALVFVVRALQRLWQTEELERLFQVPMIVNFIHVIYLLLLGLALWLLCPKLDSTRAKENVS